MEQAENRIATFMTWTTRGLIEVETGPLSCSMKDQLKESILTRLSDRHLSYKNLLWRRHPILICPITILIGPLSRIKKNHWRSLNPAKKMLGLHLDLNQDLFRDLKMTKLAFQDRHNSNRQYSTLEQAQSLSDLGQLLVSLPTESRLTKTTKKEWGSVKSASPQSLAWTVLLSYGQSLQRLFTKPTSVETMLSDIQERALGTIKLGSLGLCRRLRSLHPW